MIGGMKISIEDVPEVEITYKLFKHSLKYMYQSIACNKRHLQIKYGHIFMIYLNLFFFFFFFCSKYIFLKLVAFDIKIMLMICRISNLNLFSNIVTFSQYF